MQPMLFEEDCKGGKKVDYKHMISIKLQHLNVLIYEAAQLLHSLMLLKRTGGSYVCLEVYGCFHKCGNVAESQEIDSASLYFVSLVVTLESVPPHIGPFLFSPGSHDVLNVQF